MNKLNTKLAASVRRAKASRQTEPSVAENPAVSATADEEAIAAAAAAAMASAPAPAAPLRRPSRLTPLAVWPD